MKQIVSNYTYSPTANCVTLTGVNIDADQLLLIVAPEAGRTLYNFASVTGSVVPGASTRVNLTASTAGLTASSPLVIYYDDQATATSVTGTVALDPTSLLALENVTVTIGSLPAISGTVTANVFGTDISGNTYQIPVEVDSNGISDRFIPIGFNYDGDARQVSIAYPLPVNVNDVQSVLAIKDGEGNIFGLDRSFPISGTVGVDSLPPIVGTVTANLSSSNLNSVTIGVRGAVTAGISSLPVTSVTYVQTPNANFVATDRTLAVFGGVDLAGSRWGPIPLSDNGAAVIATGSVEATQPLYPFTNTPRPYVVTVGNSITIASLPAISGTVTANVANSVTIGSLPVQLSTTTIGGTSRLNVTLSSATTVGATAPSYGNLSGGSDGTNFRAILTDTSGRTVVTVSNFPSTQPVSLASLPSLPSLAAGTAQIGSVTASISGTVPVSGTFWQTTQPVSGTVTANGGDFTAQNGDNPTKAVQLGFKEVNGSGDFVSVDNDSRPFPVKVLSGTVTANLSKPTWTDYSGTIVTAGTAVTAISTTERSYLLVQVTTGQMFLNIGATCTTGNGVYFSAGQGFAWETSVPQGIVSIISSVTGTNYVLKDG